MSTTVKQYLKARTTNSTATSFTAKIPTVTAPTHSLANGIFDLFNLGFHQGDLSSKFIDILPHAIASDNNTFNMRLWGWKAYHAATPIWVPRPLLTLACTVGAGDGAAIASSTLLVDTISITSGDANAQVISPADDTQASIMCHLRGCRFIEFDFDLVTGTSMNAFWTVMDQ